MISDWFDDLAPPAVRRIGPAPQAFDFQAFGLGLGGTFAGVGVGVGVALKLKPEAVAKDSGGGT